MIDCKTIAKKMLRTERNFKSSFKNSKLISYSETKIVLTKATVSSHYSHDRGKRENFEKHSLGLCFSICSFRDRCSHGENFKLDYQTTQFSQAL